MGFETWLKFAETALRGFESGRHIGNLFASDEGVAGQLSGPDDYCRHEITLAAHGTYEVRLSQPLIADYDLYIFDTNGQLIAKDEGTSNPSSVTLIGSGSCIAAVRSQYGAGPYTLTLSRG
jgi:hypothetical protein